MASTLENRLDALMHEIRDIRKDLILDKVARLTVTKNGSDYVGSPGEEGVLSVG